MGALHAIVAVVFKTLFFRLPLGIWLAAMFGGAWVAAERHYDANYPLLPYKLSWPLEFVNPTYPDSPSRVPQLAQAFEHVGSLNVGFGQAELAFGQTGYGVLLGMVFGLLVAWPCGMVKTLRNYTGFLMFPVRVAALGAIYATLYGFVGGWMASTWSNHLLTSGYLAVFGFVTPLFIPLPFALLRPLFPSLSGRQADVLIKQARHEAATSLASVAKYDKSLGDVTKGKPQQEWTYYSTVCGVFIGTLLAEKRGVSKSWRRSVERQVRSRLNKQFEKGEHGLTAVMQFCHQQLERNTKLTTEVIVGLWLAMQMKGDLNPQRDRDLAASLGAHLIQGMSSAWSPTGNVGTVLVSMLLWLGVGALGFAAMEPAKVEQQLVQFGWTKAADFPPADDVTGNTPPNVTHESAPEKTISTDQNAVSASDPAEASQPVEASSDAGTSSTTIEPTEL